MSIGHQLLQLLQCDLAWSYRRLFFFGILQNTVAVAAFELLTIAQGIPVYFPAPLSLIAYDDTVYCTRSVNWKNRVFIAQGLGEY
jgi:hypothetical protein